MTSDEGGKAFAQPAERMEQLTASAEPSPRHPRGSKPGHCRGRSVNRMPRTGPFALRSLLTQSGGLRRARNHPRDVPYLNSLSNGFAFDDPDVVRDNPMITENAPAALLHTVYYPGALYRPVTMLTYMANHQVSPDPFGFHLVNILLHALVTLAVLALARELLGSLLAATVAAALFAVHPVHTEAVSNVVGRAELLAAFLVLVTLLAEIAPRAPTGRAMGLHLAALLAFAAGLLAKESAFTAIALIAIVVWWVDRGVR